MSKSVLLLNTSFHPSVGGVENSLRGLSESLVEENYNVFIITGDKTNSSNNVLSKRDKLFGADVYRYKSTGFFRRIISCYKVCRKVKKMGPFDEVISRSITTTLCAKLAGLNQVKYVAPAVYKNQNSPAIKDTKGLKVISYYVNCFLEFAVLRTLKRVYVFSESMGSQINKLAPLVEIRKVFPGVDRQRFHPLSPSNRKSLRQKLGVYGDKKILLCLGRLESVKGFDLAIRSFSTLPNNCELWIVGDGSRKKTLEDLSYELKVNDRVKFFRFTDNPEQFFQASDIFLMTSRYEPLGQVILEAASCNTPIVAFKSGGNYRTATSEIANNTKAKIVFTQGYDYSALSRTLTDTLNKQQDYSSESTSEEKALMPTWFDFYNSLKNN